MEIEVPKNVESKLKELAQAAGFGDNVQQYVLDCSLNADNTSPAPTVMLPRDKWKAEFQALLDSFPKRGAELDDSRESIYHGDGE